MKILTVTILSIVRFIDIHYVLQHGGWRRHGTRVPFFCRSFILEDIFRELA